LLVGRAAEGARREEEEEEEEECSECGGTGLCPRCKGEGFVFKQLPEEAASRARKAAKNMATRYTSGLPTKWTYCNRCSSTRSCTTCGGSGAIPKASSPTTTTL
jgi:RecJ-like exonuclease